MATRTIGAMFVFTVVLEGCTVNASCVGPVMLNAVLVAEVSPLDVATKVYPLPPRSIRRLPKKAIPLSGLLLVKLPDRVPPAGLFPMAIVIGLVAFVTMLPSWSRMDRTIGAMFVFTGVFDGWTENESCAAPKILKALLVTGVNELELATRVYPLPPALMRRLLNVAKPLSEVLVKAPINVPLDGLFARPICDLVRGRRHKVPELVTYFDLDGRSDYGVCGCVARCRLKNNCAADAAEILKAMLVVEIKKPEEATSV